MSRAYSKSRRGIIRKLLFAMAVLLITGAVVLLGSPALAVGDPPLTGANVNVDLCYHQDSAGYVDKTTEANDIIENDVPLGSTLAGPTENIYIGMNYPFRKVVVDVGTAGVGGALTWQYWDGVSWTALTPAGGFDDPTISFTGAPGLYEITLGTDVPPDWATRELPADPVTPSAYWVRAVTTTAYTTLPWADQISAVEYNFQVTVNMMDGSTTIPGLESGAFLITGGDNTIYDFRELSPGVYQLALTAETHNYQVKVNGYATSPSTPTGELSTILTTVDPVTMQGNYILKVVRMNGTTGIEGLLTDAFTFGTPHTDFKVVGGGVYQFAVPATGPVSRQVVLTGYVTHTGTTGALSASLLDESGTPIIMQGDYKMTVSKMDGNPLMGATVSIYTDEECTTLASDIDSGGDATGTTDGDGIKKFALASGDYYYEVVADGYVTVSGIPTTSVTTGTLTENSETMEGNYKLKVVRMDGATGIDNLPSGAFTFGRAHTDFDELGGGVYRFAIPAGDAVSRAVAVDGYVTHNSSTSDVLTTGLLDDSGTPIVMAGNYILKVVRMDGSTVITGLTSGNFTFGRAHTDFKELTEGKYRFAIPFGPPVSITVALNGYATPGASTSGTLGPVLLDDSGTPIVMEGSYKMTVSKMNSDPLVGATVTIYTDEECTIVATDIDSGGDAVGVTNGSGIKKYALAAGDYYYEVVADGYVTVSGIPTTVTLGTQTEDTRTMVGDYQMTVYMMDGSIPLVGATVTIYTDLGCTTVAHDIDSDGDAIGTTDGDGIVKFALDSGEYYYEVAADGYVTVSGIPTTVATGTLTEDSVTMGGNYILKVAMMDGSTGIEGLLTDAFTFSTPHTDFREEGLGVYRFAIPVVGDDASREVAVDGYVTHTGSFTSGVLSDSLLDDSGTPIVMEGNYLLKVYGMGSTGITGLLTDNFTFGRAHIDFKAEGLGVYRFAIPAGDAVSRVVRVDGYVTDTGTFTSDALGTTLLDDSQSPPAGLPISMDGNYLLKVVRMDGSTGIEGLTTGNFTFGRPHIDFYDLEDGEYQFAIPAGEAVSIQVAVTGYVTHTGTFTSAALSASLLDDSGTPIVMQGDYQMTVYMMDGVTPLEGATVDIWEDGDMAWDIDQDWYATGVTDEFGVVKFALESGTYYYEVYKDGYADVWEDTETTVVSGTLTADSVTMDGNYILKVAMMDGTTGITGLTTDNFTCTVTHIDFKALGEGRYQFAIPSNDYENITVAVDGYVTNAINETSEELDYYVLDDSGDPIVMEGNYKLKVVRMDGSTGITGLTTGAFIFGRAHIDFSAVGGGVYQFAIPSGDAVSRAVAVTGYVTNTGTFTSGPLGTTLLDDSTSPIVMEGDYQMTVSKMDGSPLENAHVEIYEEGCITWATDIDTGIAATGTTNGDGVVKFALDSGFYDYKIAKDGYVTVNCTQTTVASGTLKEDSVAMEGNYKLKVVRMDGSTGITGLDTGTFTFGRAHTDFKELIEGVYQFAIPSGEAVSRAVAVDGYVTHTGSFTSDPLDDTLLDDSVSPITMQGNYMLKVVRMDGSTGIEGLDTGTFTFGRPHIDFKELIEGKYQFAIPAGDAVSRAVAVDGYVTHTGTFTSGPLDDSLLDDSVSPIIMEGNYMLKVVRMDGSTGITGLLTDNFTFGRTHTDFKELIEGKYQFAIPAGDAVSRAVAVDGYVTHNSTFTSSGLSDSLLDDSGTPIIMEGNYILKVVRMDGSTGIDGLLTDAFTFGRAHIDFSAEGLGVYRFAIPAGPAVSREVAVDGYVTNISTTGGDLTDSLLDDSSPPIIMQGTLKVIAQSELGISIVDATFDVYLDSGLTNPATLIETKIVGNDRVYAISPPPTVYVQVTKAGYLPWDNLPDGVVLSASSQSTVTSANKYAIKITVQRESDNTAVTGSTVTAGVAYSIPFIEDGTTGIHYGVIPVTDTGTVAMIVHSQYETKYLDYTRRTADTDPQITLTARLIYKAVPIITNIQVSDIDQTGAIITWDTDKLASSQVEYGTTSSYDMSTPETDTSPRVISHSVTLENLSANTVYHFRVMSTDDNTDTGVSGDGTFKTLAYATPIVDITVPAAGEVVIGSFDVKFTTNDGGTTAAEISIDGAAFTDTGVINGDPGRYSWDTTGLANGSHTLQVRDTVNGVTGYSNTITVIVNNGNVPAFTWDAPDPGSTLDYTTTVNAAYTVSNFDPGTVEISVNGAVWVGAGDNAQADIDVQVGTNTLLLRAYKTVGGVPTYGFSSINTFVVSAPTLSISLPVGGAVVTGSVTITAAGATDYQIDGGTWVAIATAWDTTAVANGSHTIRARNTGTTPTAYSDTITVVVNNGNVPAFTWTDPDPGSALSYRTTVDAEYTVTNFDGGTVKISVNGAAWADAGNTSQLGITVQVGTNTLQLRATKTLGGVATYGYSSINTFVVNAQGAPIVDITAPEAGEAVDGSMAITATTNGGANVDAYYQIDGGAWVDIGTDWTTTVLADGSHTIRAKDTVGGVTGYSDIITVIVNNGNVPAFSWTFPAPGSALSYRTTVDATYVVTNFDGGTVEISVNGADWAAAGDAAQASIAIQVGTNTLQLRATKTLGGVATYGYSSINTFVVNAQLAPEVVITNPPAGAAVFGSFTIAATNGDNYQIDGGAWVDIGTDWTTTVLANGSHTIRAKGTVGGVTGYSDIITVIVNNGNVPNFSWTTPTPGDALSYTTTVDAEYTVGNFKSGSVKISVNGAAWTDAGDSSQAGITVQVGTNTLQLRATKIVAGVATIGYSTINTFVVNAQEAPEVDITAPEAGALVSGSVTIEATNGEWYQIDGGDWVDIGIDWDTTVLLNGFHTIRAKGGTPTGYSDIITVIVNNGNVPEFTWTTPAPGSTIPYTTTVDATYEVTNFDSGTVQISVNTGPWTPAGDTAQASITIQVGTNTLQLRATKTLGGVTISGYSRMNIFTVASGATEISDVVASNIAETGAEINWTTDVASIGNEVEYGTTSALGSTQATTTGDDETTHSATLSGLSANTVYYYRVKSTAGGATTYSDILTFTTAPSGVSVTSISAIKTYATADGTYANGWSWTFSVTVPTSESTLKMKFANWVSGGNIILVADNMRFYSAQAETAVDENNTISITLAGEYSEAMTLIGDLDASKGGRQIEITVEARIPADSAGGSYTTSYGILTE